MDFDYTPEEETFRAEAGAWLEEHVPKFARIQDLDDRDAEYEKLSRAWQKALADGGWAGISWPKEYGGRGATLMEKAIWSEELVKHDAPEQLAVIGISMTGPVLMQLGTDEQKSRFIRKILTGEEVWCQGFSEPNAGSDLANVQMRAVSDGDDYVVTGQKVWTSMGHLADWCILVVRTDPDAAKHKGLSFLLVDMKSEGIAPRPLIQMTGHGEFSEVFFDNVRVPKKNLVGAENDGWRVAIATLMYERAGLGYYDQFRRAVDGLVALARERTVGGRPLSADVRVRQKLAQAHMEVEIYRLNSLRGITKALRGEPPGPEGSINKLYWSEMNQRFQDLGQELQGPYGQLMGDDPHALQGGRWMYPFLRSQANTIEAGTSAIQRNIIGERVLGLPKG